MTRGKAGRLRKDGRQHAGDLAEAGRVGEKFGLGTVEMAWRSPGQDFFGYLMIFVIACAVTTAFTYTAFQALPSSIRWTVGGVFFAMLFRLMTVLSGSDRLFLYSGGVARLVRGEPGPQVLRWADVETVTIATREADDGDPRPRLVACGLHGGEADISVFPLVGAAYAALAPRLVPALIGAYESGEPAAGGLVDPQGIRLPDGTRFAWAEISAVTMQHDPEGPEDVVTRIAITASGAGRTRYLDLSGIPNGIFLARLIAHAAVRNGVRVDGREQLDDDLPGPGSPREAMP